MNNERMKVVKGDIAESLHRRFKMQCAKTNMTMSEVLAELVEEWVKRQEESDRKES